MANSKILIILGTRPEIIKLSSLIKKLQKSSTHILVNTNQNFDDNLNKIFFKDLGIKKPDYDLKVNQKISTIQKISKYISTVEKILIKEKPNCVVYLGDTNTCFTLIAVKKLKIPIFHFEAGNRCFDERVPEEVNRRFADHISDINLVYSEHARRNLINEGIDKYRIINTGSPMLEVLNENKEKIANSNILKKINLKKKKFILISFHREENLDNPKIFSFFERLINQIIKKYKIKVLISTHPRLKIKMKNKIRIDKNIIFHEPFCFSDYINLQLNSLLNLSDSGTLMEETSILKTKSILLREKHERQEGMDEGVMITSKLNSNYIIEKIDLILKNKNNFKIPSAYNKNNFSEIALKAIYSYTDYIDDYIWFKDK